MAREPREGCAHLAYILWGNGDLDGARPWEAWIQCLDCGGYKSLPISWFAGADHEEE